MQFGKKNFKKEKKKKAGVAAPFLPLPRAAAFSLFLPHFPCWPKQAKSGSHLCQSIGKLMEHSCDHFAASDQLKKKKKKKPQIK